MGTLLKIFAELAVIVVAFYVGMVVLSILGVIVAFVTCFVVGLIIFL